MDERENGLEDAGRLWVVLEPLDELGIGFLALGRGSQFGFLVSTIRCATGCIHAGSLGVPRNGFGADQTRSPIRAGLTLRPCPRADKNQRYRPRTLG